MSWIGALCDLSFALLTSALRNLLSCWEAKDARYGGVMRVVHYTKEASFGVRPITIKNAGTEGIWCKPIGGLWASPLDSKFSWQDWCQAENFRDTGKQVKVILDIEMGNFITINSEDDLSQMPWYHLAGLNLMEAIDFEKLVAGGVDGIYLTEQGQWATRFSYPRSLYGWDCESILILNERCIKHHQIVKEETDEVRLDIDIP